MDDFPVLVVTSQISGQALYLGGAATEGVFQLDNARPHIAVETQRTLQSVDKLPIGLRDHQVCLQLIAYEISLDNNSSIIHCPSFSTTSMELHITN
ncbi:hypothetical protein TNCV_3390231 [Trichonephila clavipes]|nr:hypothetical protein TNCV_3390231 [Trichonephila clavipes]